MKFETILSAYGKSCKVIGLLSGTELEYHNVFYRQRDAFRARLVEMYAEAYSKWQAGSEMIERVSNVIDGWE